MEDPWHDSKVHISYEMGLGISQNHSASHAIATSASRDLPELALALGARLELAPVYIQHYAFYR